MDCLSIALAVSLHLGLAGDYNSLHPHARCDVNNTVAGVYLNSEKNLSGRRFVVSNGKFDGDFTFYSHTNVKIIDEWSLTTFDKGMYECISLPAPPTTLPFQNITTEVQVYGEEYGRIYESKFTETDFGNQTYDSYCLVNDFHNNDRKYQYVQRTNHQIKSFYHSLGNYEISISLRNLVQKCDKVSGGETLTSYRSSPNLSDSLRLGEFVDLIR